jgi:hypothetical protein
MTKLSVKIDVQIIWLEEPTNFSQCKGCQETIYSKMYRLWIMPKAGKLSLRGHETGMVLCESCYEMVNGLPV